MSKTIKIIGLSVIGVMILGGGFFGWRIFNAKRMASEYAALALRSAQGNINNNSIPSIPSSDSGLHTNPGTSSPHASPSMSENPNYAGSNDANGGGNSSLPLADGSGSSSSIPYKQLMADTYTQSINAMETVKANTLALQNMKISLSAYKASIKKAKETFSSAQTFVQQHPPSDDKLAKPYEEFLTGITLANQSMDVVLNGISSLDPASFFAAKDMGSQAKDQVNRGYSKF